MATTSNLSHVDLGGTGDKGVLVYKCAHDARGLGAKIKYEKENSL
jgi:hypothetical protein